MFVGLRKRRLCGFNHVLKLGVFAKIGIQMTGTTFKLNIFTSIANRKDALVATGGGGGGK